MALGLSLPPNADRRIRKVGDVVYLIDPDNGKPVYTFSFQMGHPKAFVSGPLTQSAIAETVTLAPKLATDIAGARPISLLITSLDDTADDLLAFIAAWTALQIFIEANFKSTYETRWFTIMADGAPASSEPVFKRFKEVMSDKYRLADKFLVIASVLDPGGADDDDREFRRLKKFRDGLLHALDTHSSPLPTEAVQNLLLKYMRLHFDTQK